VIGGHRGERPGHSATTAHFQAAYPFLAQGALGAPGVYIGRDASGGAFAFDPWELYERRIVRSPNMLVFGGIGYAKSAFLKTYVYRQFIFGRQAWVIDVKGEYGLLAEALGVKPIALAPGGDVRLNPISRRGGRESQLSLLRSVALTAHRRDLAPEGDAGCGSPSTRSIVGDVRRPDERGDRLRRAVGRSRPVRDAGLRHPSESCLGIGQK
jgi:hypothetical protein